MLPESLVSILLGDISFVAPPQLWYLRSCTLSHVHTHCMLCSMMKLKTSNISQSKKAESDYITCLKFVQKIFRIFSIQAVDNLGTTAIVVLRRCGSRCVAATKFFTWYENLLTRETNPCGRFLHVKVARKVIGAQSSRSAVPADKSATVSAVKCSSKSPNCDLACHTKRAGCRPLLRNGDGRENTNQLTFVLNHV